MTKPRDKPERLPSQERLRVLLDYDPKTGILTWKWRTDQSALWNGRWVGKTAMATIGGDGYCHGTLDYVTFRAHRIIWKWLYGNAPSEIDHANGIRSDNREVNLKASDRAKNAKNLKLDKRSTTGVTGVTWVKSRRKWVAHIGIGGKSRRIGSFASFEEAVSARKAKERELGYSERHGT